MKLALVSVLAALAFASQASAQSGEPVDCPPNVFTPAAKWKACRDVGDLAQYPEGGVQVWRGCPSRKNGATFFKEIWYFEDTYFFASSGYDVLATVVPTTSGRMRLGNITTTVLQDRVIVRASQTWYTPTKGSLPTGACSYTITITALPT